MKKKESAPSERQPKNSRPVTKEEALRQLIEQDPRQAARLLQEILKGR